jgi:hypothetical protein
MTEDRPEIDYLRELAAKIPALCDALDEARRIATVASALHRDAEQDARNAIRERDAAHREVADRTAERDEARANVAAVRKLITEQFIAGWTDDVRMFSAAEILDALNGGAA